MLSFFILCIIGILRLTRVRYVFQDRQSFIRNCVSVCAHYRPYFSVITTTIARYWLCQSRNDNIIDNKRCRPRRVNSQVILVFQILRAMVSASCRSNKPKTDGWLKTQPHSLAMKQDTGARFASRFKVFGFLSLLNHGMMHPDVLETENSYTLCFLVSPICNFRLR